jgi:hypothetical protein
VIGTNKKINAKTSKTSKVGVSFEHSSLKFIYFDENYFFLLKYVLFKVQKACTVILKFEGF